MKRSWFVLALVLALFLGVFIGGHPTLMPNPIREVFVDKDFSLQAEVLATIKSHYYKDIDTKKLSDTAASDTVDALNDRFSGYLDPLHNRLLREVEDSKYSGVGLNVGLHRRGLRISRVFPNSPAARAGIRRGYLITKIDGRPISDQVLTEATNRIKGRPGTYVRLTVVRPGHFSRIYRLKRVTIDLPLVEARVIKRSGFSFGVAKLSQFTSGAFDDLEKALERFKARQVQGLVLDLRGNPGGLLDETVDVAGLFLKGGVVLTTKGLHEPTETLRAGNDPLLPRTPLVVLVDRFSASAAEVVAGALKDRGRATLVGERTFGKGVVQQTFPLSNGGAVDLTVARYYTPGGHNLHRRGVKPQVEVKDRPQSKDDEALEVALKQLARKVQVEP